MTTLAIRSHCLLRPSWQALAQAPDRPALTIARGAVTLRSGRELPVGALFDRFRTTAARAAGCPSGVAATAHPRCGGHAGSGDIEAFMHAGRALIHVECDRYFTGLARSRRRALRDLGMVPSMIEAVRGLVLHALHASKRRWATAPGR